ncbi:HNH endonuclease [Arthrobacter sp. M4]|uniref:HNH endonuclease n=1 Tax=Arthrobacter sp. M4 TaxID=218160 RepID=UPI001CDC3B80|nr:HNH endonuclease [Arthrobacter sp. M4]MCA4135558.1 HNH endonuclease [Arthrobacter sp. M4]
MTAVLLAWDPARWSEWNPSYPEAVVELARTGVFRRRWVVSEGDGTSLGQDAWLILRGSASGLIGHGVVTSVPYEARETNDRGTNEPKLFVDVDFDALLNVGDQIPLRELVERASNTNWSESTSVQRVASTDEASVRAVWAEYAPVDENDPILPSPGSFPADALTRVTMNRYERDSHARRLCLAHYGTSCAACGFSFEETYGQAGEGFIHIHHVVPMNQLGPRYELDPIRDLIPLCPNCHYMAHRRQVPYTLSELRHMMRHAGHIGGTVVSDAQLAMEEDARRILEG